MSDLSKDGPAERRAQMLSADETKFPRRFGPYVLVQFLGEGGMGRVYLALMGDKNTDKLCVIKRMGSPWSNFSADQLPEIEERFRREAKIAMSLSHGSIAQMFHAGNEQGPYLVQEFIHGKDLRSVVSSAGTAGESLPIYTASYIVSQIARGLAYLHDFQDLGLVHRDVTPENIMLAFTGEVKLIDFGVAKATALDDSLTQATRGWLGKPDWTAPELFQGEKLDRRADLFSLGLLYWYLLSGKDPGSTLAHPVAAKDRLPPPSAFNPDVSEELNQIVAKSINVDPALRFQRAEDFQREVSRFVPPGFLGEREISTLLSRYSHVRKNELLAKLVAEARPLLDQVNTNPQLENQVSTDLQSEKNDDAPLSRHKWSPLTILLLGVAGLLLPVLAFSVWRYVSPSPAREVSLQTTQPALQPSLPPIPTPPISPPPAPPVPNPPAPVVKLPAVKLTPPSPPSAGTPEPPISTPLPPQRKTVRRPTTSQPSPAQLLASAEESFERSNLPEALTIAQLAAKQGAGAAAFVLIGRILAFRNDVNGARAAFEQALRLSPDNSEAARRLERLRRVLPEVGP
jgi:serine/threonine-protein kinase